MPGNIWLHGVANKGAEGRIVVDKSLGHVFLKGFLAERSDNTIRDKIRPHLNAISALPLGEALAYKATLKDLISRLNDLSQLSLWVAHYDLNKVNVLVNEKCDITALID
ncbi:hypothetical protein AAL_01395 [Moelleriella libera RCEF 2490]|uniref:Protein kinase-like domain protein n=1 Tax=Moelleriella libera RCEF 2490 TaxID=1081109 RepID=A0A166U4X2_9HYPO|nr:hypothetical protein AAL_01395 [Moelleriella libera RCEF 2490]